MSYTNLFLTDFTPVFHAILKEKRIAIERLELVIIDEETENYSIFEPADVSDVLHQLGQELNALTIYTDRPAYFEEYAKVMFEENGLVVMLFQKQELKRRKPVREKTQGSSMYFSAAAKEQKLILDFEWEGDCYYNQIGQGKGYIPIHKKPWKVAENLDITVPFGYNTVIVKGIQKTEKRPAYDRFEEGFYRNE